eukprot:4220996-Karenia_brevis.AAC.1
MGSAGTTGRRSGFFNSAKVSPVPGASPSDLSNLAAWLSSPALVNSTACSSLATSFRTPSLGARCS